MELYVDLGAHSYSIYIENNILKEMVGRWQ